MDAIVTPTLISDLKWSQIHFELKKSCVIFHVLSSVNQDSIQVNLDMEKEDLFDVLGVLTLL